jgi:hypothetical protein
MSIEIFSPFLLLCMSSLFFGYLPLPGKGDTVNTVFREKFIAIKTCLKKNKNYSKQTTSIYNVKERVRKSKKVRRKG